MAWCASSKQPELRFKGGDSCTSCHQQTLCRNGVIALPGSQIVTCNNCDEVFCAQCGRKAQVTQTHAKREQHYFCPVCDEKR